MRKKIFSLVLFFAFLMPCVLLFSACGEVDSLSGKTLVYSKVEVEGNIEKSAYETSYKSISFEFDEGEVTYKDGENTDIYDYKYENHKVYLKATTDSEFSSTPYAEMSGKYMVVSDTVEGGIVKVYFKVK